MWKTARTCVYDLYVDGQLVYVGCSRHPDRRLKAHKKTGLVPAHVVLGVVRWYDDHAAAMAAELSRIQKKKPPLNIAGFEDRGWRAVAAAKRKQEQLEKWQALQAKFAASLERYGS